MADGFGIESQWELFIQGKLDPEAAAAFRELIRTSPDLLDDQAKAYLAAHPELLAEPLAEPPPQAIPPAAFAITVRPPGSKPKAVVEDDEGEEDKGPPPAPPQPDPATSQPRSDGGMPDNIFNVDPPADAPAPDPLTDAGLPGALDAPGILGDPPPADDLEGPDLEFTPPASAGRPPQPAWLARLGPRGNVIALVALFLVIFAVVIGVRGSISGSKPSTTGTNTGSTHGSSTGGSTGSTGTTGNTTGSTGSSTGVTGGSSGTPTTPNQGFAPPPPVGVIIATNEPSFTENGCTGEGKITWIYKFAGIQPGSLIAVRLTGPGTPSSIIFNANPDETVQRTFVFHGPGSWTSYIVSIAGHTPPSSGRSAATVYQC